MSGQVVTRDGRPCRVVTRGGIEERTYLDDGASSGWRTATHHDATTTASTVVMEDVSTGTHLPANRAPIRNTFGAPEVAIVLHRKALDSIARSAFWWSGQDGRETGGWLEGTWTGEALHIIGATRSDDEREPDRLTLNRVDADALELFRKWGVGLGRCGIWHVHPRGEVRPSDTDFEAFEAGSGALGPDRLEPYYCGIIVGPDERGSLATPTLRAWVTSDDDGGFRTEPARIVRT